MLSNRFQEVAEGFALGMVENAFKALEELPPEEGGTIKESADAGRNSRRSLALRGVRLPLADGRLPSSSNPSGRLAASVPTSRG